MARVPAPRPPRPAPEPAPPGAPRVVAVVGPTASGKTRLAMDLAHALGGEIVSADSQQIYRGLDVGTAKPTRDEQRAVRHHLIDIAEPTEAFSAGDWARRADQAIADITSRGALPLIVGGTGLWIRALLLGIIEVPAADLELRRRLEEEGKALGLEALHRRLAQIDPLAAAAIPPANRVRLIRALELHALTGERPSALWARHRFARLRYRVRALGLSPPRAELYRRIDERARAMFEGGILDEARALVARGLWEAPALKALGYREALGVIEGRLSLEEAVAATAQATRHYAKRQLTWFRAEPFVEWLAWPPDAAQVASALQRAG